MSVVSDGQALQSVQTAGGRRPICQRVRGWRLCEHGRRFRWEGTRGLVQSECRSQANLHAWRGIEGSSVANGHGGVGLRYCAVPCIRHDSNTKWGLIMIGRVGWMGFAAKYIGNAVSGTAVPRSPQPRNSYLPPYCNLFYQPGVRRQGPAWNWAKKQLRNAACCQPCNVRRAVAQLGVTFESIRRQPSRATPAPGHQGTKVPM